MRALAQTWLLVFASAGVVACQDHKVAVYNTAPSVSILLPMDQAEFATGDPVEFKGVAQDSQDDPSELTILWSSSIDGEIGSEPADANGNVVLVTNTLTVGNHIITLSAVDLDGVAAQATVRTLIGYGNESVGAPTAVIIGPANGESFTIGSDVNFVGSVTDTEQAWDTLTASLVSDKAGTIWSGSPEVNGTVSAPWVADFLGTHNVVLFAEDADGHVASDEIVLDVVADSRPEATIIAPTSGTSVSTEDTITFEGVVSDIESAPEQLAVSWVSDLEGTLAEGMADSAGYSAFGTQLSEGVHAVTLTVMDEDQQTASDTVLVDVLDPNNVDDDGDGYTENEGDCDDTDSGTHPTAPETCDRSDNNCDGNINEAYWDSYEENETEVTAYDIGEVDDGFLWAGASLTLSGLTFHSEADADYFYWEADDEIYDNVAVHAQVGIFSSGADHVIELYMDDGGWSLVDSASGSGVLHVYYDGDIFDSTEDDFMVKVYPSTWTGSCTDTYNLEIES